MLRVCSELEAVLKSVDAHVGKEPLPWVLVDSGANQVLRPWSPEVEKELGQAAPLDVTLASGERRRGWKTTQGEVVLPKMFASSSPWILPVSRVVRELGYQVIWKPEAVELQSPSGRVFTCVMKHDLPYLRWKDFKDIRRQLAKSFQESSRRSYASQVSAEPNAEADEENLELTKADEIDASEDTEVWTSKMLCLEAELVAAAAKVRDIQASALEAVSKAYLAEVPEIPAADLSHVLETLVGQFPFVDRCCPRAAHRLLNTILLKQLPAESEWSTAVLSLDLTGDCVIVPSKEQAVREGGPKKWKSAGLKRWRMHNHPTQPKKVVWVSSVGDVVWTAPHTSTMLSFEERRPSQGRHDVDEYVRRGIHGYTAQQHYSLYMHSYETPDEVDDDSNHPGVECSWLQVAAHHANLVREARPSPDVWVKVGHVLIRRHFTPRVGMYEPVEDEVCKQPGTNLSADRVTIMLTEGGGKSVIIDRWTDGKPGRALLPDKRTWRGVTLFGILNPSNSDEVPEGAATVAAARTGQITEHVAHRYWLPEPAAETEMHRMEAVAENLETDELVNVSVDPREVEQATEPERSRWMEGIQGELSNLEGMEVFERITREEYESRKVRDPRLARPLPAKLVLVKKPNPESPDPENPYKHKARIVICGNMQPGAQKDLSNRAEVPDAFFTRCVFALTMILSFSLSVLDVNAAFLYAELPETEPTVVVAPPGILKRLGYAGKTELWRLRRALYGLRVSPKCWTKTRNNTIRGVEVELPGGETAVFHPADAQEHVWVLVGTQGGIVGYLLFYVDDILLAAALRNVFAIRTKVSEIWKVKDQGILANPADKSVKDEVERSHNAQKELGFLGMRIGFSGDGDLECHQIPYVKSCLKERGFSDLRGSQSLPNIQEGMEPEFDDRNCDEYRGLLRKGQQEIGSLLWASQRTRPDIAAVIGVLGSMLVTHPRKVVEWKWSHQVWRYLAATLEHKVVFDRRPNQATQMLELSVSADASFAAGGDKSRRGVVAMLNGYLVQWSSIRQSLAAQSAVETEIQAAGLGCTRAVAILNLVKGLIEGTLTVELLSDNTGCIANIMHTVTTWRNRHFCVRAAALRDQLTEHEIVLRYRSGKLILADALTKVLGRQALELARAALGIRLSANAS
ncbi:TY2B-DR3 [Symbiodinium sp. KB8]|nr:TY2B-DR3 [Symbiodinium sp. KB8]